MKMTAEATEAGARVTGIPGLNGWAVETNAETGAVTLVPPRGEVVTTKKWRDVPLGAVLRAAKGIESGDLLSTLLTMLASEGADGGDPARSSRSGKQGHYRRVAKVYRMALKSGLPPRKVIAEHFGTTDPSAGRWIAEARKAGLLAKHEEELSRHAIPKGAGRKVGPDGELLPPVPVTAEELRTFPEPIKRNTGRVRSTPTRTNASTGSEDQK